MKTVPDKNQWIAAIENAIDFRIDEKEPNLKSPQFSYDGWRIAVEHTKKFKSVVLKWLAAAKNEPAPVEGWLVCPSSDQKKGWDYRVYLVPRELKSLLRTLDSLPKSGASRHQAFESRKTQDDQFLFFFNNCGGRNHVKLYGKDAFFDLNTTGSHTTKATDLRRGQTCIVATPATPPSHNQVVFNWFSFLHDSVEPDDTGLPCRVFFGEFIKSETLSKSDAARRAPYSAFFNRLGHFKQQSVICQMERRVPSKSTAAELERAAGDLDDEGYFDPENSEDERERISPDTLVIAEEFGEWEDSRRRIDLLAIDQDAKLVVIELKRNEDGEEMELQAIRYAAMVSTMTFEKAVEVYAGFLAKSGQHVDARQSILEFLEWDEPDEDRFAQDVRMVLVSADFSMEVTTAVMWLNKRDLDIRCIRIKPYSDSGRVLLDVQQIIPLPEAAEYQVRIREKELRQRTGRHLREHISEQEFLADFDAERPADEHQVARHLVEWARANGMQGEFRRGKKGSAFIPVIEQGGIPYYPFSLLSRGWISVQLRWLKDRPPFSNEQKRHELLRRITDIPGLIATEAAIDGFPKVPITSLIEAATLERFKSILDWTVQEIRNSALMP